MWYVCVCVGMVWERDVMPWITEMLFPASTELNLLEENNKY